MNSKINVLVATLLALGIAGSASAATDTKAPANAQRCNELTAQFDAAKASHASAKGYTKAVAARDSAAAECKAGQYNEGVAKLDAALHDIGVKPLTHKS